MSQSFSKNSGSPVLCLKDVSKQFGKSTGFVKRILTGGNVSASIVRAVSNVNLHISEGEVLGLVGESGCGKSTLGRLIASIHAPSSGNIQYRGQALEEADRLKIQMIFQDPQASLNPRMTIANAVGQAALAHGLVERKQFREFVAAQLTQVGLDPNVMDRYPHQLSGGQRQRVGLARALAVKPDLLVCDEAIAALDVSIQAQVLNLFIELQKQLNLTYLFISHDLGVVRHICDRVAVMYLGRIVEVAETESLFTKPQHPYTRSLLQNLPDIKRRGHQFTPIKGEIPSPLNIPTGCAFNPRCSVAVPRCSEQLPELQAVMNNHEAACHVIPES